MSRSVSLGARSPSRRESSPLQTYSYKSTAEFGTMDHNEINWKEAFLFFYWDIEKHCPEGMNRVNELIQHFLFHKKPSAVDDIRPQSWNTLLAHLMRVLRCHLASNILPDSDNEYEWLDSANVKPARPYVNWIRLAPHFAEHWSGKAPAIEILAVINHLETVAYGPLESRPTWSTTMQSAWHANPFLVDFQQTQELPVAWSVPLAFDIDARSEELKGIEIFLWGVDDALTHELDGTPEVTFDFTFDNNLGFSALICQTPDPFSRRTLNLAKRLYTGLLLWVDEVRETGRITSLCVTLEKELHLWKALGDTMEVNKALWNAMRKFRLRAVQRKRQNQMSKEVPLKCPLQTPVKPSGTIQIETPTNPNEKMAIKSDYTPRTQGIQRNTTFQEVSVEEAVDKNLCQPAFKGTKRKHIFEKASIGKKGKRIRRRSLESDTSEYMPSADESLYSGY
ncbi:hypothetical protein CkaCkLH20_06669 [Colletotrichum karsti]|uniref:Uncharacterized protein n=1 Tax=Colletotrichum karsti TaxID=1095194 RepID=A0A9P6I4Q6_9PEZI|nr:uncharacterized protein CkaCkLH20_06669 [Colletotrichum karsti]KAF9875737.1 hypothetical protein CkaCkLH20_06669 [Colletotrichum karsti]